MDSILSQIAESSVDYGATKQAYGLLIRILRNIAQAARRGDPDLEKYKWVKAHKGSALVDKVLSVDPLFRQLLEVLGFRFILGRPPYLASGNGQEYFVLRDGADIDELDCSASVLEAVVQSFPLSAEDSGPSAVTQVRPVVADNGNEDIGSGQRFIQTTRAPSVSPPASQSVGCRSGNDQSEREIAELREEQRRRYEQRQARGIAPAVCPTRGQDDAAGSGEGNDSSSSWWWHKFRWGGNNNDDSNADGDRSSSARRTTRSNRMMTLRDLPKPQRRG